MTSSSACTSSRPEHDRGATGRIAVRPVTVGMQRAARTLLSCVFALTSACTDGEGNTTDAGQDGTGTGTVDATVDDDGGPTGGTTAATQGTDSSETSNGTATSSDGSSGSATGATTEDSTTDGTDGTDGTDDSTGEDTGSSTGAPQYSDDPFDPEACYGMAWTADDAAAALGGLDRLVLADSTIQVRTRTCPGGVCGEWGEPEDWVISYLTWSGGVVTAYKDFLTDMRFVLFDDEGTPRLSMQHVTFPTGGYPDTDGVVYDLPPAVVGFAHLRAYDDDPDFEYYYQDLDYLVTDATLVVGQDCAVWTANPYGANEPFVEQYGVVFHW